MATVILALGSLAPGSPAALGSLAASALLRPFESEFFSCAKPLPAAKAIAITSVGIGVEIQVFMVSTIPSQCRMKRLPRRAR